MPTITKAPPKDTSLGKQRRQKEFIDISELLQTRRIWPLDGLVRFLTFVGTPDPPIKDYHGMTPVEHDLTTAVGNGELPEHGRAIARGHCSAHPQFSTSALLSYILNRGGYALSQEGQAVLERHRRRAAEDEQAKREAAAKLSNRIDQLIKDHTATRRREQVAKFRRLISECVTSGSDAVVHSHLEEIVSIAREHNLNTRRAVEIAEEMRAHERRYLAAINSGIDDEHIQGLADVLRRVADVNAGYFNGAEDPPRLWRPNTE